MQIHTGQKGRLGWMSMDPAKGEESKIILHKENFFFILRVTIIRPTILSGDENMRDCEFISHQFSAEDSTGFNAFGGIGTGKLEKLRAQIAGHHDVAQAFNGRNIFYDT